MRLALTREHIIEAQRKDRLLPRKLTPEAAAQRKTYRVPGVTGTYATRKDGRTQWTWYARRRPFRGKTVGDWRREAAREGTCIDAKYMLLKGNDTDRVIYGSREDVLCHKAHMTSTSSKLMYTDLRRSKAGNVVSAEKSRQQLAACGCVNVNAVQH